MDYQLIYVTTSSNEEALAIGRAVIEARLAACANILGHISSIYWWKGHLEESREVALLLKTRSDLVDQIVVKIQEVHSYTCPCIVALPITTGNHAFLEWIAVETTPASPVSI